MDIGDIIQVTGGFDSHKGIEGVVTAINGTVAVVQPIDTNSYEPNGEPFEINSGLLTWQPSQTEIRKAKRGFREDHIAKLRKPPVMPPPKIREFVIPRARRRKTTDY